jgi:hypothetical protein
MNDMCGIESRRNALRNPFGVDVIARQPFPRVAAAQQPWATLFKPFGLSLMTQSAMVRADPMSQDVPSKRPPKKASLLVAFILVLVIVHFLFDLAFPIVFIYDMKSLARFLLSDTSYYVWLCQPLFIAACLFVAKNNSRVCKRLVYTDIGLSVLQPMNVFLLYVMADKIG